MVSTAPQQASGGVADKCEEDAFTGTRRLATCCRTSCCGKPLAVANHWLWRVSERRTRRGEVMRCSRGFQRLELMPFDGTGAGAEGSELGERAGGEEVDRIACIVLVALSDSLGTGAIDAV